MLAFSDVMAAHHALKLCRLVLTVTVVATPIAAFAQATGAPPTDLHRYPPPTYEEDRRALTLRHVIREESRQHAV